MANLVKNKKNKKINPRVVTFWSIISAITLALLISVIVLFIQNLELTSKDDLKYLEGNEIFNQKEEKYFVLVYGFDVQNEEELDDFEKVVLNYQTFLKKHYGDKIEGTEYAFRLYAVDSAKPSNYKAIVKGVKESNITGATAVTNSFSSSSDELLRISENDLPTLLIIENGEVINYKSGVGNIQKYLQEIIDKYVG